MKIFSQSEQSNIKVSDIKTEFGLVHSIDTILTGNTPSFFVKHNKTGRKTQKKLNWPFGIKKTWFAKLHLTKGQLNSEWIYEVIVSPKMQT